ncbi:hypothetical protein BC834DRAFT_374575 [Gloeopeniophorella convolvens]|nr:hypothetical protein BC834DRAFT_374575 [Gloeopeniophorella convolvens]
MSLYESPSSYWTSCLRVRHDVLGRAISSKNTYSGTSLNAHIEQMFEDEIGAVITMLQMLRTHRNAASTVAGLPFDVLVLIFEACKEGSVSSIQRELESESPNDTQRYSPATMGSIVCSQVCRRWRDVALATPSLWTDILIDLGPRWLDCSLARSNSLPRSHLFGHLTSTFIAFAKQPSHPLDFSHITSLTLRAQKIISMSKLFDDSFPDAPALKAVKLSTPSCDPSRSSRLSLSTLISRSPSLACISLVNVLPTWDPLLAGPLTLTRLEITTHELYPSVESQRLLLPCVGEVLKLLQDTPTLKYLVLDRCFGHDADAVGLSSDQPVDLPGLKKLGLSFDHVPHCLDFFQHICVPSPCHIRVSVKSTSGLDEGSVISVILETLRRFSTDLRGIAPSGSLAFYLNPKWMQILVHSKEEGLPLHVSETPCQSDADINLVFYASTRGLEPRAILGTLHDALSLSLHVRTLMVQGGNIQTWRELARCFPHVTTIVCRGDRFAIMLVHMLSLTWEQTVAFPELRILKFQGVGVSERGFDDGLFEMLHQRRAQGRPLERLILDSTCAF